MADNNLRRGPICSSQLGDDWIDAGTLRRQRTPSPADRMCTAASSSMGALTGRSDTVETDVEGTVAVGTEMTWDGFWRLYYDVMAQGIQKQANELLTRGLVTSSEARDLVDGRIALLRRVRNELTPFGEMFSEIKKPSASLKNFETFLEEKGSIQAVLRSVGKTRASVDQIAVVSRVAGPALLAINVAFAGWVVWRAPERDRKRVAFEQGGQLIGGLSFGTAGMWAGCGSAALLVSPFLALPGVGEGVEGAACFVGGLVGGFKAGTAGVEYGRQAGDNVYNMLSDMSPFEWTGNN